MNIDYKTFESGLAEGKWVSENFFRSGPETETYMNSWFDDTYSECDPSPEYKKGFISFFGF